MSDDSKTREQFLLEIDDLKNRLAECEDTLEAIRTGAVDALVVSDEQGEKIFSLQGADYSYRVMLENINEGAVTLDKDGVVIFANRAFADLAQREMSTLAGARLTECMPGSVHERFSSFLKKCIERPERAEFAIRSATGFSTPVTISGTTFKSGGLQNFCLIISDLRERKDAERKLKSAYNAVEKKVQERTAQLLESEERFSLLVENVRDYAIFMLDAEGRIVSWNAGAQRLKGYRADEIIGKHFSCFYLPDDLDAANHELALAAENGQCDDEGWRVRKDGSYFWASVITTALRDKKGVLRGFAKITQDITQRKGAEESLRLSNALLKERNEELDAFNYSVSHDLRGPLTAIDGFGQMLLRDYGPMIDETGKLYINHIIKSSDRMARIISDILNLSQASHAEITREKVDLSAIVRAFAGELKLNAPGRDVEFVVPDNIFVDADPGLMRIVMENLVRNAWKFTSKKPHALIEFLFQKKEESALYGIRDNGAGLDMTKAGKLFTPFTRLHTEEEFPGTGIGLAIVRRIIERHGGKIWAEGEAGKGASIYFELPDNIDIKETGADDPE